MQGFGLDKRITKAIPMPRWAYITDLARVLADTSQVAKVQQLLLHALHEGGVGGLATPAMPDAAGAEDDEDDEPPADDDDEALDVPESVRKKREAAWLAAARDLLAVTMDPSFHTKIQVTFFMTEQLEVANKLLQTDNMTPRVMATFEAVYKSLASFGIDADRVHALRSSKAPLDDAVGAQSPLERMSIVTEAANGDVLVLYPAGAPPPLVYKQLAGATLAARLKNAAVLHVAIISGKNSLAAKSVAAGALKYDKWMRPLWNFAEQREVRR